MTPVLRAIDRALNHLYTACGVIGALFLILLASMIILSIITRMLGTYIPGLSEYAGYSMAASSFFALAYTFREGGHIRVALLRSKLSGTTKWVVEIWCLGLAAIFANFLAFYFVKMAHLSWRFEERSEGADATLLWWPQALAATGACVMAIATIHGLIKTFIQRDPDAFVKTPAGIGME